MNVLLFLALLALCCGYAIACGGSPERIAAAIILAAVTATVLVGRLYFGQFSTPEVGILLVDLLTFAALTALATQADRFWPMLAAACVGVGLLMHGAVWLAPKILPSAYATFHAFSAYPTLLILAAGTWRHRRRLRWAGTDRSWSSC